MKKFTRKIKTTAWRSILPLHRTVTWGVFRPIHDLVRDLLSYLKIIKHYRRQDYLLGWLHPERKVEDFILHLKLQGFDDQHFASWVDEGELMDLRLRENFDFQYHLRIFHDREVRGHYEVTPESRPIAHLRDTYTEPRTEQFLSWIEDWVIRDKQVFAETQYPTERRPRHEVRQPSENDADL